MMELWWARAALASFLMAGPVWAQYTITTVAGNGDVNYSGDSVPSTQTAVNPAALALDTFGNLYLADNVGGRSEARFARSIRPESSPSPVTVTATSWDQSGSQIDMQSFTLLANGHTAFNVATQWPATATSRASSCCRATAADSPALACGSARSERSPRYPRFRATKTKLARDRFCGLRPRHAVKLRLECPWQGRSMLPN